MAFLLSLFSDSLLFERADRRRHLLPILVDTWMNPSGCAVWRRLLPAGVACSRVPTGRTPPTEEHWGPGYMAVSLW